MRHQLAAVAGPGAQTAAVGDVLQAAQGDAPAVGQRGTRVVAGERDRASDRGR